MGKCTEEEYLNVYNERVRWRLKDVITLDMIRKKSLDCAEVYSEFVDVPEDENIPFDAEFHPERSKPEHTGIRTNVKCSEDFFLHEATIPGTAGCIDIGDADRYLFPLLMKLKGPISLEVK